LFERAPNPEILKHIEELKPLPDEEVIALTYPRLPHDEAAAVDNEMTRRQLVASRNLTQTIRDADRSARRAARWLIIFTIALVTLSAALLVVAVVPLWSDIVNLASHVLSWTRTVTSR
jgi:hypothetical protein